jgi:hypothetical protein
VTGHSLPSATDWALPLHAYTGHGGAVAALVRDGQRAGVAEAPLRLAGADVSASASAERLAEFRPGNDMQFKPVGEMPEIGE